MDTLANYRQIIERILTEYSLIPYSYGQLERRLILDRHSNHYMLMTLGWEGKKRVHGCLVHLEIIDGKIWVQRDGTEDGIATELVAAGIPKSVIVLAFHPPYVRPHTEYAVG